MTTQKAAFAALAAVTVLVINRVAGMRMGGMFG